MLQRIANGVKEFQRRMHNFKESLAEERRLKVD